MATKDELLLFKKKRKSFNNCLTDTGSQYSDLNLNQNLKGSIIFSIQSNSKLYKDKKIDYTLSERYEEKEKSKTWKKSSATDLCSKYSNDHIDLNDKNEKCWNKNGSSNVTTNSTLSLRISAYKNLNEASSDSFDKSSQKSSFIQKQKEINCASKFVLQSPFEFQRQQNDKVPESEVSQFKASQRLLNLNKSDLHSNTAVRCSTSFLTQKAMTQIYRDRGNIIVLKEQISKGTFGKIHNGLFNGEIVAIKRQKIDEHTWDEWKILSSLNSRNIVKGIYYHVGKYYMNICMEKGDANLKDYISQRGHIEDKTLFSAIASQIINGLEVIHGKGIIHRDIKPSNVLICGRTFKICDFGLAIESSKEPVIKAGSTFYTAPEVVLQITYDTSADIWSLGVLLYYLRLKTYPFRDGRNNSVVLRDMMRKVVFDGNIKSAVLKYLASKNNETFAKESHIFDDQCVYYRQKSLIMNCLQPEPTKRSTAAELLRHRLFMDLRDRDFYDIPLYVRPTVAPEDL